MADVVAWRRSLVETRIGSKGKDHATLWTCDVTGDYVQINVTNRSWLGYFPTQKMTDFGPGTTCSSPWLRSAR